MFKKLFSRFVDYLFRKKSLYSCLYLTIVFFLSQLTLIGQSAEIKKYCDKIQDDYPDSWLYHIVEIVKLFYVDGSTLALIISGVLIIILIVLIYRKNRELELEFDFDPLAVYKKQRDSFDFFFDINDWKEINGSYELNIERSLHKKNNPMVTVMMKTDDCYEEVMVEIKNKNDNIILSANSTFAGKAIVK